MCTDRLALRTFPPKLRSYFGSPVLGLGWGFVGGAEMGICFFVGLVFIALKIATKVPFEKSQSGDFEREVYTSTTRFENLEVIKTMAIRSWHNLCS